MSSSDDNSQKRGRVHRKLSPIFCSTPMVVQTARRLSSISISAVETNSSSSASRKSRESREKTVEKAPTKKRKRKQRLKGRGQKRRIAVIDPSSEWETKLEQSVHGEAIPQKVFIQKAPSDSESVLFKDVYGSPERVREAWHFVDDDCSESPVFRPIRRALRSPEKIGFKETEGILAVEDLPTCQARVDDVDQEADTEDELILRKRSRVVTYPGSKKEKWHKIGKKTVECHVPVGKDWYYVETANQLWDNFVKNNPEKFSKNIGRSALREHRESQSDEGGECLDSHKNQSSVKTVFEKWGLKKRDFSKLTITRGWQSRSSKKWVRVEDAYIFDGSEDPEFQKRDRRGKRMTLNEYLRKCKMEKENLRHCSLDSCSSVASQNTGGSRRARNDWGTIQKGASPCKNLEYEFKRSTVQSTTQSQRRIMTRSSLKRANNALIDSSDAKRRLIVKNKPRIRAIELVPSKYSEYIQFLLALCEKHYAD